MDIASELVFRAGPRPARVALVLIITFVVMLAVLSVALAAGASIADRLQPASEPIIAAPLRWH